MTLAVDLPAKRERAAARPPAVDLRRRRADPRREHAHRHRAAARSRPTTRSPSTIGDPARAPSWAHPFGTDSFGRDVLSRVISAYTIDMQIAVFATIAAVRLRHARRRARRLLRRHRGGDLRPRRRCGDHLPLPGAGDRHRLRARARPRQHVHRRRRGRLGVLRPAGRRRGEGAEAPRLCRRRPRHGLRRRRASSCATSCRTPSRRRSSTG